MSKKIIEILMERDGMTEQDAAEVVRIAQDDLNERLAAGELPHDICQEHFNLEPDFIFDLIT